MSDIAGMQSIKEIVTSLGGPKTLASRLKMSRTTILGWLADGHIPAARLVELHDLGVPMPVLLGFIRKRPDQRPSDQAIGHEALSSRQDAA